MKRIGVLLLVLCANLSYARGSDHAAPPGVKWKTECSSCHLAYPPQLLSRENWQQLMGKLDKHFGANATLDAKDTKDILAFLQLNGAEEPIHSAASLRISDTPWFRRRHRNVAASEWVHPDVKSRSNCTACHIDPGQRLDMAD